MPLTAKALLLSCMAGLSACAASVGSEGGASTSPVFINAEAAPPLGPYSSAVRAGDLLFLSGVVAFNVEKGAFAAADITAQTEQAFDNLEAVLASAGADLSDLVKVTVYLKDASDMQGMNAVYARRLGELRPARTTVPGVDFGRDDILIEIDAAALCGCD